MKLQDKLHHSDLIRFSLSFVLITIIVTASGSSDQRSPSYYVEGHVDLAVPNKIFKEDTWPSQMETQIEHRKTLPDPPYENFAKAWLAGDLATGTFRLQLSAHNDGDDGRDGEAGYRLRGDDTFWFTIPAGTYEEDVHAVLEGCLSGFVSATGNLDDIYRSLAYQSITVGFLGDLYEIKRPELEIPVVTGIKWDDDYAKAQAAISCLPEVVIYQHINFGGAHARTNLGWKYVGDWWNDTISSIVVASGVWRFYEHIDFGGRPFTLGPGYYSWVESAGIPNDLISSFKPIAFT